MRINYTGKLIISAIIAFYSFQLKTQHFQTVWSGNGVDQMNFYIYTATVDGDGLKADDEIAVFCLDEAPSTDTLCVGTVLLTGPISGFVTFVASKDDPLTPGVKDGFTVGDEIIIRYWDDSKGKEIVLIDPTYIAGDGTYYANGTAVLDPITGYSVNTWNGSAAKSNDWHDIDNWSSGIIPIVGSNVIIPVSGVTNYPTLSAAGACNHLRIEASSSGVGSLLDNEHLDVQGKTTIETYLSNSATDGSFRIHLVGPTLDEENYTGTGTGAYLSAFNVAPGSTYAYGWDESAGTGNGWVNLTSLSYEIQTGTGIGLSTTDDTDHTLSMTGDLITGDVTPPALSYSNNHYELISNPYPSAIDFDEFATETANSGVIENKYWIWDPTLSGGAGNYVARAGGSGGSQYVQVGQGFFVETKTSGSVTFKNSFREHSSAPFRDEGENLLAIEVSSQSKGIDDRTYIRFVENATFDYDQNLEAEKWNSMNDEASMIRTIAADDTELAINALPLNSLNIENISVPIRFHCGYDDNYTLSFDNLESFEPETEIWLQDNLNSSDWININGNPAYTFNASTSDPADRFVIHFFGPTSVNLSGDEKSIIVYAYQNNAYVINKSDNLIKNLMVFDLSGRIVSEFKPNNAQINKVSLPESYGCYIIKAVTDNEIITQKVISSIY